MDAENSVAQAVAVNVVTSTSDVTSILSANPFVSLCALVTRKNRLGQEIAPGEAISREEALRT